MTTRPATRADIPTIVTFNLGIAAETEDHQLDPTIVTPGVTRFFDEPAYGFYSVAESTAGDVVGGLLITYEWSDWRNGLFWWIQSVYVHPDHRRTGVFRALHAHVHQLAEADDVACGLRLYADKDNTRAHDTYTSLGFKKTTYLIFEQYPLSGD